MMNLAWRWGSRVDLLYPYCRFTKYNCTYNARICVPLIIIADIYCFVRCHGGTKALTFTIF